MNTGRFPQRNVAGLSLVELLVATAITLIGLLVITQVFAVYEGWKRTTTGIAQSQEGGLLGAFMIEQDLRHAGLGMIMNCSQINAYNSKATASNNITLSAKPVAIVKNDPVEGSDRIGILYSSSPFANISAKIQREMATSASTLYVDKGLGFSSGDLVLVGRTSEPCSILQVTGQPVSEGQNVTAAGSSWKLPHIYDVNKIYPWNPPESQNIFPSGGYLLGASVLNLGQLQLVYHEFYVEENTLRMVERNLDGDMSLPHDLIPGVIGLRAEYLPVGINPPTAIRFSLIVRSGNWEKEKVSSATIDYWKDETLVLNDESQHYRYRVFQTIVPLKNIIWNP